MNKEMILATVALPDWLFEQDYLIFLALLGWMLIALLAWANPLGGTQEPERRRRWLWFILSAASGDESGTKYRDYLMKYMSPEQIVESEIMARRSMEGVPKYAHLR